MIDINSRSFNLSLVFLITINMLPHIFSYSTPVLLISGSCILWRILFEYQKVKLPSGPVKLLLVAFSMSAIYYQYGTVIGLEAGSAGILIGTSLKLIDRKSYHDVMVTLLLVFMVLLTQVLKSQTLWITIFAAFDAIIITGLLLQIHSHKDLTFNPIKLITTGAKLFLKASPLMILLFFVFPRLSYNLRFLPGVGGQSDSGFNDVIDPGDISSVALLDKLAFRVEMKDGEIPETKRLYWVGGILSENKGMKWSKSKKKKKLTKIKPIEKNKIKDGLSHKIFLPPRFKDWLFALDRPQHFQSVLNKKKKVYKQENLGHFLKNDATKQSVYTAISGPTGTVTLSEKQIAHYTNTSGQSSVRVKKFVEDLKAKSINVEHLSSNILRYFEKNLRYTLKPKQLKGDQLEDFLFETKSGFCEHFASSFATLVRMAGYPSRVIIGFQGGEVNPYDGLITVKDKDAHAWAEVWSEDHNQWIRYDPVNQVAALRLSLGGQAYFDMVNEILNSDKKDIEYWLGQKAQSSLLWLKKIDMIIISLSTRWTRFLNEFDRSQQVEIFNKVGISNVHPIFLIFISLLIFVIFYFWIKSNVYKQKKLSPIDKCLNKIFNYSSEKLNFDKKWNEGPETFFNRLASKFPSCKNEIENIKNKLIAYKYSSRGYSRQEIKIMYLDFKKLEQKFKK